VVQGECRARSLKNVAAVDDAQRAVHAQAQPLEDGGEVPGIDAASVHRGLVGGRRARRTASSREPRDGAGGALMGGEQGPGGRHDGRAARGEQRVQHQGHPDR
jgi:hypothetical protein